ncbi:hypothetical protein D6D13_07123 [Aureobasidium pullulans]|uniref:Uncharacterized protein n=1 Tax=Aureobasidium pullulans TaxID=5580 RepID=A0A4S9CGZ2_AURPU|nr:hypothetical protein D6D13_07123 [Aureobasidium pullulans]
MNTSISSDPSAACPRIAGLWARVPPAWESANYTERACSVPACNNFPSTLATCCGCEETALDYFNTTVGPYVSCNLDSSDDKAYQNYQQCLLSNFVTPFKCNDNDGLANSDVCQGGTAAPPQEPGKGEQICATQATPNATRAMISCCSNAAANGTGLIPLDNGCNIACSSESTEGEFLKCLTDAFGPQIGIVCSKQEDSKASNKNGDTSGACQGPLPSLSILGVALLALLAIP